MAFTPQFFSGNDSLGLNVFGVLRYQVVEFTLPNLTAHLHASDMHYTFYCNLCGFEGLKQTLMYIYGKQVVTFGYITGCTWSKVEKFDKLLQAARLSKTQF